jgi:hypothetical protein
MTDPSRQQTYDFLDMSKVGLALVVTLRNSQEAMRRLEL